MSLRRKYIADTSYPFTVETKKLSSGVEIAYYDTRIGAETLVLLHGLGSYSPAWVKNIQSLQKYYRCVAVDLPGFGKSSKTGFQVSMHFFQHAVTELLDGLHIDQVHVGGHSMGGQVAIHLALQQPQRVGLLLLAAPAGLETFTSTEASFIKDCFSYEKVMMASPDVVRNNMLLNFFRYKKEAAFLIEDRLAYIEAVDYPNFCKVLEQSVKAMLHEPVYHQLSHLGMPVLIMYGEQDAYIPNRFLHPDLTVAHLVKEACRRLPQAKMAILPNCGHFIQFEQATVFNYMVLNFLDRTTRCASENFDKV